MIGDAPPNREKDVKKNRDDHFGEKYWRRSKFGEPTTAKIQAELLKEKGIPIHAFYVHELAAVEFKKLADQTGGKCGFLDIHSEKGAEDLTNVVTVEILREVGRSSGTSDQLIQEYNKRFNKSYH